jgi:hypothetical protein
VSREDFGVLPPPPARELILHALELGTSAGLGRTEPFDLPFGPARCGDRGCRLDSRTCIEDVSGSFEGAGADAPSAKDHGGFSVWGVRRPAHPRAGAPREMSVCERGRAGSRPWGTVCRRLLEHVRLLLFALESPAAARGRGLASGVARAPRAIDSRMNSSVARRIDRVWS